MIDGEDKDAYNECMGRLAANEDLKKRLKNFIKNVWQLLRAVEMDIVLTQLKV